MVHRHHYSNCATSSSCCSLQSPIVSDAMGDPLQIMRVKSFSMPPITAEEAAAELDACDHPFYVFRNKVSISRLTYTLPLIASLDLTFWHAHAGHGRGECDLSEGVRTGPGPHRTIIVIFFFVCCSCQYRYIKVVTSHSYDSMSDLSIVAVFKIRLHSLFTTSKQNNDHVPNLPYTACVHRVARRPLASLHS